MASLQPSSTSNPSADLVSPQHMRTLNDVKRDVVDTIRQVVDIVSKYAGGALPEPARARVRGFILHLPQRWATASRQTIESSASTPAASKGRRGSRAPYPSPAEGSSHHSHPNARTVSRPTSPASSRSASAVSNVRVHMRNGSNITATTASGGVPAGTANQAAQRILTLATESLDMLRGVTGVFKESLDRADALVIVIFRVVPKGLIISQLGRATESGRNSATAATCPYLFFTFRRFLWSAFTVILYVYRLVTTPTVQGLFRVLFIIPAISFRCPLPCRCVRHAFPCLHRYLT